MDLDGSAPVWDWYQGTLMDDSIVHEPDAIIGVLSDLLGGTHVDQGRGRWGYADEYVLRSHDGEVIARLMHGGRQPWPTCWGSGHAAVGVSEVLRGHWAHRVTRVDSALDYAGPGAWEALYGLCIALADDRGITVSQAGDWHRGIAGRTLYIGSKSSPVFLRLYEKGKQLGGDPDWVRVELCVRPQKEARVKVTQMGPEDVWGLSVWARDLYGQLSGVGVPRVVMRPAVQGDDRTALDAMVRQYSNVLGRLYDRLGADDETFGRYLMDSIRLRQGLLGGDDDDREMRRVRAA